MDFLPEKLRQEKPFTVPEDYFDDQKKDFLAYVKSEETGQSKQPLAAAGKVEPLQISWRRRGLMISGVAAAIALLLYVGFLGKELGKQQQTADATAPISQDDLYAYVMAFDYEFDELVEENFSDVVDESEFEITSDEAYEYLEEYLDDVEINEFEEL